MITIDWPTGVITIPQQDLTYIEGSLYELNLNWLRLQLKAQEGDEEGQVWPDTHVHITQVTMSGTTYARFLILLPPYTVTFEDVGSHYIVRCVGANHNLVDRANLSNVSLVVGNAAGLILNDDDAGPTVQDIATAVWQHLIESGLTAEELMRLQSSVLFADADDLENTTPSFKNVAGDKVRIRASYLRGIRRLLSLDGT